MKKQILAQENKVTTKLEATSTLLCVDYSMLLAHLKAQDSVTKLAIMNTSFVNQVAFFWSFARNQNTANEVII